MSSNEHAHDGVTVLDKHIAVQKDSAISEGANEHKLKKDKPHSNWSKIFRPWKWKRKKKSEKFSNTAVALERQISVRSSKEDLIKRGVLKEVNGSQMSTPETIEEEVVNVTKAPCSSSIHEEENETEEINTSNRNIAIKPPRMQKTHSGISGDETGYGKQHQRLSFDIANGDSKRNLALQSSKEEVTTTDFQNASSIDKGVPQDSVYLLPQPKARGSLGMQSAKPSCKPSGKEDSNIHPPTQKMSPLIPPNVALQNLNKVAEANVAPKNESNYHTHSVSSREIPEYSDIQSSVNDMLARPVAAKRTQVNMPNTSTNDVSGSSSKGPPPLPPPKPVKNVPPQAADCNSYDASNNSFASVSSDQNRQSQVCTPIQFSNHSYSPVVIFASSFDITNNATQVVAPNPQAPNHPTLQDINNPSQNDYDSDSSGPVLYKEEVDDDEEDVPISGFASKVARKDTLHLKLANRPGKDELEKCNIISNPQITQVERSEVKKSLTRRLSERPPKAELQARNILPRDSAAERFKEREEVKRQLSRKLSMRPTVKELVERKVLINWHEYVEVYEVQNYDRRVDKPWTRLTPATKASIRKELNEFKANEMDVHEDSRCYTRFHKP